MVDRAKYSVSVGDQPVWPWDDDHKELVDVIYRGLEDSTKHAGSKLALLERADGTVFRCAAPKVLAGKLRRVKLGAEIAIVYLGMVKGQKGGKDYKDFDVLLTNPEHQLPAQPGDDDVPF